LQKKINELTGEKAKLEAKLGEIEAAKKDIAIRNAELKENTNRIEVLELCEDIFGRMVFRLQSSEVIFRKLRMK